MYVSYVSSSMCLMALISSGMSRGEDDMPSSLVFQICLTNIMTCALSISPPISPLRIRLHLAFRVLEVVFSVTLA